MSNLETQIAEIDMERKTRIFAQRNYAMGDAIQLYCKQYSFDGGTAHGYAATSVTFEECLEGREVAPLLTLTNEEAQELVDHLWNCGVQASQGAGTAGAMTATKSHLEDMRKIAFHKLNIK